MLQSSEVLESWKEQNKDREYKIVDHLVQEIEPSKIIAINDQYKYPEILNDHDMRRLKKKIQKAEDWDVSPVYAMTLRVLKLPSGEMIVHGNGNHRAVLAKELKLPVINARVFEMVYLG